MNVKTGIQKVFYEEGWDEEWMRRMYEEYEELKERAVKPRTYS